MLEHINNNKETWQVAYVENDYTARDVKSGYVTPELSQPDDARVKSVATQIERPRHILRGIADYNRELDKEFTEPDVKRERLRAVVHHHSRPVIRQMLAALDQAEDDLSALEAKRQAAYSPPTAEKQTRYNQLRSEMQNMERKELISHIATALRNNERDTIEAIALYPHNNSICPETYYWQAQRLHESNYMGDDARVVHDLKLCVPQLARAVDSFTRHADSYCRSVDQESKRAFDAAMSANFEAVGVVVDE